MISNPILRGFCPDPSIIRVENDFYIATSTFEWFPGVRLFHSKDLKNWEQIKSPIQTAIQANLQGDPNSGGIWAPCLSYDGTYFYLVYTDVKTKKGRFYNTHNYVIRTKDLNEKWSDPVYLNRIGFDPSLFHDIDGKKYLVNMINGFKGVLLQEYDPESGCLLGERKLIYKGSGIGCTEGPHLYHIGDWYYLMVAEGGTGYSHCVTLARSKEIWGPYETAPENPILTSDPSEKNRIKKCGHADIVDTPTGEWYLVHLCSRPDQDNQCILGRETAIQKMIWKDDWLELESGGRYAQDETPEPRGMEEYLSAEIAEKDDFNTDELSNVYVAPRISPDTFTSLSARKDWIRIYGQESINSWHKVSLLARRQQEKKTVAATCMDFNPECSEQMAGLMYIYDSFHFYFIGKTLDDNGNKIVVLLKSDKGEITDLIVPIIIKNGIIEFKVIVNEQENVNFYYRLSETDWNVVGETMDAGMLSDENCRGFTGAQFGLYVHDMAGLGGFADFNWFSVH